MSGHSKWATIKRHKAVQDAKKAAAYTKVTREIIIATQKGGPDPDHNSHLRMALQNARAANLPKENILRAIKKGSGADTDNYMEVQYEGYAATGVAILVACTTDNLNRTVALVRSLFTKYGGSLGKQGSITHLFDHKGTFLIERVPGQDFETQSIEWIEAGVEDIEEVEEGYYLLCPFASFGNVQKTLEAQHILPKESRVTYLAHTTVSLPPDKRAKVEKLIQALEAEDDVQEVFHNMQTE